MIPRTRVAAAAVAIAAALGVAAVLAQSPSDYDGVVDITIRNSSTDAAIHGPVAVEVRAQNMVDGGYVEDDASDVLFTSNSNAPVGGIAPVLDSNEATWWWYADVQPESATDVRLFVGGPEGAPMFPLNDASSVTVPDSADLDQTGSLDLEFEFVAAELGNGTMQLVSKEGAYEVGVRSGGELYAKLRLANLIDTLRPNGAGTETASVGLNGCTSAWQCIDDVTPDNGATFLSVTGDPMRYHSYALTDHSLPSGATIQEVTVHYTITMNAVASSAQPGLRSGTARKLGSVYDPETSFTYATVSSEPIDRPASNTDWTQAPLSALDSLEVVIGNRRLYTLYDFMTQVYVEVGYRGSSDVDPELTYQGIQAGRRYKVHLAYDGTSATLDLDGSQVDTTTVARALAATDADLLIGGDGDGDGVALHGGVGSVVLGSSATVSTLALSFGSEAVTPGVDGTSDNSWEWTGTIATESDSGTVATYAITHDPTDVEVVVGPLILAPNKLPGEVTADTVDLVGAVPLAVFLTPGPSPTPSPGRSLFIGPLIDSAESSGMPVDAWWILVGTLVVGPATALGFKHLRSYVIMSIAGVVAIFVISQIAGLGVWWTAFSALWKAGVIGVTQYWRGS